MPSRRPADHPLEDAMHLLSGSWALHVLYHLRREGRALRFGELRRLIGRVAQKELTRRLRELERSGLVVRTVHAEVPPRVEYALTPLAMGLAQPLDALARWAEGNRAALAAACAPRRSRDARPTRH